MRLAYEAQPRPRAIASLSGETIVKAACGTNHTGIQMVNYLSQCIILVYYILYNVLACNSCSFILFQWLLLRMVMFTRKFSIIAQ